MAQLLGSRFCIESLHNDVSDLQAVVIDVFSRTGPVTQPSWKYPDKTANNVQMDELLEIYVYTDDEEERQVAHIVLLELVIDRLVVLLQAMATFADGIIISGRVPSAHPTNNTSIGLVVRKYWNRMIQVSTTTRQLQSETKSKTRKIQELEDAVEKLSEAVETLHSGTGEAMQNLCNSSGHKCMNPEALLPGGMDSAAFTNLMSLANGKKKKEISKDECNKASQTIETSFVPCEACDRIQQNLRDLGREFVSICRNQDLPSSLERHMEYVKDLQWMTHNDISRWVTEQNKDLNKLNKHLKYLKSTIEPLQCDLAKEQERTKKLQDKVSSLVKELAMERETQSIQLTHIEGKVEKARAEKQKEVNVVIKEKEHMAFAKKELENQLQVTSDELQKAQEKLREYETSQHNLQDELERSQTDNAEIRRLKDDLKQLECRLDKTRGKLSDTNKELNKEKARSKSVNKHTESLQGKQDSLIGQIDSLAEENEALRVQVGDLSDEKDQLDETLSRTRADMRDLEEKVRNFQGTVKKLKQGTSDIEETKKKLVCMEQELQDARERQRLIVEYPDLNGPVNKDVVGTGDIAVDMENQVRANSVRIKLLEDQNASLRNTITRMFQIQVDTKMWSNQRNVQLLAEESAPMPLWSKPSAHVMKVEVKEYNHSGNGGSYSDSEELEPSAYQPSPAPNYNRPTSPYWQSPPDVDNDEKLFYKRGSSAPHKPAVKPKPAAQGEVDWVPPDTFTVKAAPRPKTGTKNRQRPVSAKPALGDVPRPSPSSINAYIQLKRSGMIKEKTSSGRSKSAKPVPENYRPGDPITCDKCDKIYMHIKDLQIHKNYCFGGS